MTWEPEECSDTYNVYRATGLLIDSDDNGVANDYGACYRNDVGGTEMTDPAGPPPGATFVYAVSGQNLNGEGAIGYASNGLPRPNVTPCP
jgi:hypothetical protein